VIADVIAVDDACETSVANDSQRIIGSYPPRARSNPHIIQVLSVPNPEALSLPALEAASPPGPGKTQQQAEGQEDEAEGDRCEEPARRAEKEQEDQRDQQEDEEWGSKANGEGEKHDDQGADQKEAEHYGHHRGPERNWRRSMWSRAGNNDER